MTITNRPIEKPSNRLLAMAERASDSREWWIDGLVESIIRGKKLTPKREI